MSRMQVYVWAKQERPPKVSMVMKSAGDRASFARVRPLVISRTGARKTTKGVFSKSRLQTMKNTM